MKYRALSILVLVAFAEPSKGGHLWNEVAATLRTGPARACPARGTSATGRYLNRLDLALGQHPAAQKEASLSEEEADKLREEQDPGRRIDLYLDFAEERLNQFDQFRQKPADPKYDTGSYLDKLLGQYIALQEEMKNWIQYQYDHQGDMRKGLRALLNRGPRQLEQLRHIQQEPDPFADTYKDSLRDAMDNLTDALDGATAALSNQEKKFGEMKKQEKVDEQQAKQAAKDERKRIKEEEKLRKKERKQRQVPEDVDQN